MVRWNNIPEPINLNPLKHHLDFIRSYTLKCSLYNEERIRKEVIPLLRHIGSSVADIYTGDLSIKDISAEMINFIEKNGFDDKTAFMKWIGPSENDYRKTTLSDQSRWVIKYLDQKKRYFHIFPGRNDKFTLRSRGNTLKTAILYDILFDKGDILLTDLNSVRNILSLSPLRSLESASGIISCIRLLQSI